VRAVLVGATGGIGRALARQMAARGDRLFLLGRDAESLARSALDLEAHGAPSPVGVATCDVLESAGLGPALDRAAAALGGLDAVVVTAGAFGTQEALEQDAALRARVLAANFAGTIELCEAARVRLVAGGGGTLCVFSSVAGDRARRKVVLYGATKAGLSYYLDGLDARFRREGLRTVCVKPGFVRTAMTAGLPEPPFAADPDAVAARALRAIDAGWPVVYAPSIWRLVMLAIRALPRAVLRRLEF
jgi:decaprenylphospho-beta-D-erythro-pentofuranosid-2-ulose 2-reductase